MLCIGGLIAATFWILKPFLPAMIWAAMIVVTTWPVMLRVQRALWNRRSLAVTVMSVAMLLVLVLPLTAAIATLVDKADEILAWSKNLALLEIPMPPDWVAQIPWAGERIAREWKELAALGPAALGARIQPYVGTALRWGFGQLGNMGLMVLEFLLTVVFAAVFYASGEEAARWVRDFARRLAGEQGDNVVLLAGASVRAVAMGVVVTALVQSVLGGIGLLVAGVPFAGLLTAVMFILGVAQIGVVPVMLCAVGWLYWKDATAWATALLVWTILIGTMDNVLRPFLIKRGGADIPLVLIFLGVIGGLLAFGVVGLFIGPLVLAVVHTLVSAWIHSGQGRLAPAPVPPATPPRPPE